MKKFHLVLVLLLCLGCLCTCGNKAKVKKPNPCLSEQQMIDVMTDVYLVEAMLNVKKTQGQQMGSLSNDYYEQVFSHYGITDSIFEANMTYYAYYPEILERIMDSVTQRLENAGRDR